MSDTLFNQLQAGEITRAEYDNQLSASIKRGIERTKAGQGTLVVDVDQFLRTL